MLRQFYPFWEGHSRIIGKTMFSNHYIYRSVWVLLINLLYIF